MEQSILPSGISTILTIVGVLAVAVVVLLLVALAAKHLRSQKQSSQTTQWTRENMPKNLSGKAKVIDADDIEVEGHRVRLARIDAPEHGQMATSLDHKPVDQGEKAKEALIDKVEGKEVRVDIIGLDTRYNRLIGEVYLGELDISREMVREGWAWAYMKYGGKRYEKEEDEAKRERRGIWGQHVAPWQWRQRGKKSRARSAGDNKA